MIVFEGTQTEATLEQQLGDFAAGSYVLSVEAISEETVVVREQVAFSVSFGETGPGEEKPGKPGKWPGGPGGKFPGRVAGGRPSGMPSRASGSSGSLSGVAGIAPGADSEAGFQITAGEALTDDHVSGTKDMRLYGALALSLPDEPMTELILGDVPLGVCLDGGSRTFTAQIDGDKLVLTAEGEGRVWMLNGLALKLLMRSGIAELSLNAAAQTIAFPTDLTLCGSAYADLCAEGMGSGDYQYYIFAEGVFVSVDGRDYRLDASGELVPMEG